MKCYLCKNTVFGFLFKNNYQLLKCNTCGLVFYDFNKDYEEFLQNQYSKGYFTGESKLRSYIDYGRDRTNIMKNMQLLLNEIIVYKKSGKYLDVGCAYGYALEAAEALGFDVYGIDPSEYAIKQAKKKFSEKVSVNYLSDMKFPDCSFDVVSLFDVFEHLQDPRKDLRKLNKAMKNKGLLVIATGDTDSLWAKISGRKWTFYNPPQHIFYFNKATATKLLEESGFKVEKVTTAGKWLSMSYVMHLAETVGENKIAKLLSPILQRTPLANIPLYLKLHDNMVIFARKV